MLWFLFLLVFVFYLLYSQLIANNLEFYSLLRKQKKCKQFAKYSYETRIRTVQHPGTIIPFGQECEGQEDREYNTQLCPSKWF